MNHFTRFNLPCEFVLDIEVLEKTYQQLQRLTHPDRFATASPAEQRIALQRASQINQAYDILRQPLNRAQYLCELQNISFDASQQPKLSSTFLAQQWEWREQLETIENLTPAQAQQQKTQLNSELIQHQTRIQERFAQHYHAKQYTEAAQCVQEWKFIENFSQQLNTGTHRT